MSLSTTGSNWERVIESTLDDVRGVSCEDRVNVIYTFRPRPVKYAKFVAHSYYGNGAGLQYFELVGPDDEANSA